MGNKFHMCEKAETDETQEEPLPKVREQEASAGGGDCDQPTCQVRFSDPAVQTAAGLQVL